MATIHETPTQAGLLHRVLTTDFCPWANRFVYWLKEPVGWFALAALTSVMVGLYVSPVGWTLAASLLAIMGVGMVWPLIAVYATSCEIRPDSDVCHEDDACRIICSVRNRLPIPVWGLAVERYLDEEASADSQDASPTRHRSILGSGLRSEQVSNKASSRNGDREIPTVALACVPPLCTADYVVVGMPRQRGRYPTRVPRVACSFPFGIWTARRELKQVQSLKVWPKYYPLLGGCTMPGSIRADDGDGARDSRSGEFVGVRPFRRGDSARQIHWVASARTESLLVTQRGGPQRTEWEVWLDTSPNHRDTVSRQVRVAASLLVNLHRASTPLRAVIGERSIRPAHGSLGIIQLLDALTDVPAEGTPSESTLQHTIGPRLEIRSDHHGAVLIRLWNPAGGKRGGGESRTFRIDADESLADRLLDFWRESRDADAAA